jgi:hypothetical protein
LVLNTFEDASYGRLLGLDPAPPGVAAASPPSRNDGGALVVRIRVFFHTDESTRLFFAALTLPTVALPKAWDDHGPNGGGRDE